MKQTIYVVVKHTFGKDSYEFASIIGTHTDKLEACNAAWSEYDALRKLETTTWAEWEEFGGVRGLLRNSMGNSCSIYVKEVEVEL